MKIRSPLLTKIVVFFGVIILRTLGRSCRCEIKCVDPATNATIKPIDDRRFVFCAWHDAIVLGTFIRPLLNHMILVSRHQDGTFLTDAARMLGLEPVRGSSSRGGAQAVKQLIEKLRDKHLTMTPDGPRGPRRELKDGIVFIGSRTQHAVVPAGLTAARAWRIKANWTDMVVPKPFTKVYILLGEPLMIPEDATREELSEWKAELQRRQDEINDIADRMAAGEDVQWPPASAEVVTEQPLRRSA